MTKRLSDEQRKKAISLLSKGASVKEVASELGISYENGSAHNRLKTAGIDIRTTRIANGLNVHKWDGEIPIIKKMLRAGASIINIGKRYGLSERQMYSVIYRRGISVRRERYYGQKEYE